MTTEARPGSAAGDVPPARAAVRLAAVLAMLLGFTLAIGYLLTRADEGDPFERVDRALVGWFVDHRTPTLDALSGPASELGNTIAVVGLAVVAAVVAGWSYRSWRPAVVLAVALCGEVAVFLVTSALVDRPRPPVAHLDADLPPTSSFPSGHTAAAVCLYGALVALVLVRVRSRWLRVVVIACAVAVVAVVGVARLYRGAHYPTDVLTSVLFAVPWLMVTLALIALPSAAGRSTVGEWRRD